MDPNVLHAAGYLLYILVLFASIGTVGWLATRNLKPISKQYGMAFAFLTLFPAFVPNIMWDTWQIHLFFPLVYLLLVCASQREGAFGFHQPFRLRFDSLAIALGVFFVYAFAATAWSRFPVQSLAMILFQFISVGFAYLIFTRIQRIRSDIFTHDGELARLCLAVGVGSFALLLLAGKIVPEVYSVTVSLFEENIAELSTNQTIGKYFEILTRMVLQRVFFDSGFTFFAVLAFPLAMLMPNRNASLLLLSGAFLAVFIISNSQAAKLGLLCGICIVFFLPKLPKLVQQTAPWVLLLGITSIPFLTTFLLPTTSEFFNLAFIKESSFFMASLEPRLWIYENTVLLDIWTHPWLGHGINAPSLDKLNSISIFNLFFAAFSTYSHPHNHTLTLLVELGVVGLLLFLWVCACILFAIRTLSEQYQPYALGAFFSGLCITAFTQHLWGVSIIIWCVAFIMFAFFGRSPPAAGHQTDLAKQH